MFLILIYSSLAILATLYIFTTSKPNVVAGVYRMPGRGYWFKRLIFSIVYKLRSFTRRSSTGSTLDIRGYGRAHSYELMEAPHPLLPNQHAIDCCYFGATSKDGANIVCRLARRHNRMAEIWLFLELPGIGCLQFPRHPDTEVSYTDGSRYQAGGLVFEVIEPMKKWKITYSGKLRKGLCNNVTNKPEEFLETHFTFTWSAFSQPFNFDTDMSTSILGDGLAREEWNWSFLEKLKSNHQSHYEQWGELRGKVCVEGYEDKVMSLQCVRDHTFGVRDWRDIHRYVAMFIYTETGMAIQVGVFCQPNLMSHVKIGYVSYPNGDIVSVTDVSLKLWEVGEETGPPPSWNFSFTADGQVYNVIATRGTTPDWYHHEDRGGKVMEAFTKFTVNSHKGRGISEYFYRNSNGPLRTNLQPNYKLVQEPPSSFVRENEREITLLFTHPACSSSALVGGKGAQLAQLTALRENVKAHVSPGFCLTLRSFEVQLQNYPTMLKATKAVAEACYLQGADLVSICDDAVQAITSTEICDVVKKSITESMRVCFGAGYQSVHLAVRSSVAGEDGDEASFAGQLDTFLGVVGLDQILQAVKKCWASAFTHQAVEYRRQHGQPINVLIGVVIQEMVPAESAGVMFTVDPLTRSNSHVVINANFGLGESVVSGRSNPDTITVERHPEFIHDTSKLVIGSVVAGDKKIKIVETGYGGVKEEVLLERSKVVSLCDTVILKLATIGIELEKYYGCPRDVEWAVVGEEIYLLQCRPITVSEVETEEELIHEFDSPATCDYQWWTTANISEMLPGAVTPLTLSIFQPALEYSLQVSYKSTAMTAEWEEKLKTYTVEDERTDAAGLYRCIDQKLADYESVWSWTSINSGRSANMAQALMTLVGGSAADWTSEHYGDLALLLSSCDGVYSAEVPQSVSLIAKEIARAGEGLVHLFMETPDAECLELLNRYSKLKMCISEFLNRHGHRCIRESELRELSWAAAPEKFVSVLKMMLKTKSFEKSEKSNITIPELLNKIKRKIPVHKRWFLKWLLPQARRAVGLREWGKSIAVKMNDVMKTAYADLSARLYTEGRLPDPDLMFFLTHQEIGALLSTRSARLVIKAQKRRKIFTKQAENRLPKICRSYPVEISSNSKETEYSSVECLLKGLPVSQGLVTGPAQVVHSLAQASVIKAGDILIITSTDVGWTPYFPLLGGLVTELGSLMSHGAVVAREYGIPCVVNVANATTIIRSGEILQVDGRLGTVKRLAVNEH
ncbi:putative phosphoenolpyruvate synthase [Physella acuta]|uniref:putative phosphoenolpyruvate synthase n=1 Tax=Physella acuta TaxID=109671 RepID=UPI0027DD940B|nr:putative phosphoenolpyruvate synthase [Physella acuta]